MKTLIVSLILIFTGLNLQAKTIYFKNQNFIHQAPEILSQNDKLVFQFSANSMELMEEKGKDQVSLKGLQLSQIPHLAETPYFSFIVKGAPEEISHQILESEVESFQDLEIKPSPEMPCRCADDTRPKSFNEQIYLEDDREMVEFEFLGDFKGKKLTKVTINLARFNTVEKKLSVYSHLKVSFESEEGKTLKVESIEEQGKKYVFFTPQRFQAELNALVEYRSQQGYEVEVVKLEELGNDFDSIRESIHEMYREKSFDYALIVGHEEIFPTEYVYTSNDSNTPSDLRYFTFGGDEDYIPDVFYGRMVVASALEVKQQIKKIKDYEQGRFNDLSGPKKQVGIASNEGSNPTDVEYLNQMQSPLENTFGIKRVAFHQVNKESNASNIVKALNEGASWVHYIGHGSGNSWISINRGEFHSDDVKKLDSDIVKPIVIDVSCQNGRFSYEGRLGERFLNEKKFFKPTGAVAFYGGSVDISWHPPVFMAFKISELAAKKSSHSLGELLLKGQLELLKSYSDSSMAKENLVWYHLLGDPALNLNF